MSALAPGALEEEGSGAGGWLAVLRRRKWLIVACIVLAVGASIAASLLQRDEYTASAALLFRDPGITKQLFPDSSSLPSNDPARDAATNVRLVSLELVAQRAANDLHIPLARVTASTKVAPQGTSNVVTVSATDHDPAFAARLANTVAREDVRFRRQSDQNKIGQAIASIQARLGRLTLPTNEAKALGTQVQKLETLQALQTGNVELIQPAVTPTNRSSPKPLRNGAIALFLGALLGTLLALLRDRSDQRLRSTAEIEEIMGGPVLGLIPEDRSLAKTLDLGRAHGTASAVAAQSLRANLRYFTVKGRLSSLAITSAAPGEGKTTISWSLSAAAARAGERVLLIECDLRRPTLSQRLKLSDSPGLSGMLSRDLQLEDAVIQASDTSDPEEREVNTWPLSVLPAGPVPPNPGELLESRTMTRILRDAEAAYDFVVIDTSPVGTVADAIPLLRAAAGVVVVSRLGVSERARSVRFRETLAIVDVPILGIVIDSVEADAAYGGEYGYQ